MSNSSLASKTILAYSGNYTKTRSGYGKISEICIHHMAGNLTIEQVGALWQTSGQQASSHYAVQGSNIGQYVKEEDIAWTNSDWDANCRAVTIETANSAGAPNWEVADSTLKSLIDLVADIAKRNNMHPLVLGKSLTWHSMYAATACPGSYLKGKLQYIVDKANKINSGSSIEELYKVRESADNAATQLGAYNELTSAKKVADSNKGYKVYENAGKLIYSPSSTDGTVSQEEYYKLLAEFEKEYAKRKEVEADLNAVRSIVNK